jgi:hypothetical protein
MEKRQEIIKFRASEQEKCLIEKVAQHHEISKSELLRMLVEKEAKRRKIKICDAKN